ncbi:hypothetical protein V1291_005076 [Nitrobacteraceae bacterium AZCC 1564]
MCSSPQKTFRFKELSSQLGEVKMCRCAVTFEDKLIYIFRIGIFPCDLGSPSLHNVKAIR